MNSNQDSSLPVLETVRDELDDLERQGLRRVLRVVKPAEPPYAEVDGRMALLLCSNDYLGLASAPRTAEAAAKAARREGAGSGSARLVSGGRPVHRALEQEVMRLTGAPASLTFPSGFAANLSVLGALLGPEDLVICDEANHASLIDGLKMARPTRRVYPHRDVDAVRNALRDTAQFRRTAIVTEGLFSMDGDVAPIADLLELARSVSALLIVDDAHGTGVLGRTGRGALELEGLGHEPDIVRVGTFGKAFGAAGAFVSGAHEVVELVIHKGRAFVFSTAPPPPVAAAALEGMIAARKEPWRRARCLQHARRLEGMLRTLGMDLPELPGPIVPVPAGPPEEAMDASRRLLVDHGIFVAAIRPPTVPDGTSRLRVSTSALLSDDDVDRAARAIAEVLG